MSFTTAFRGSERTSFEFDPPTEQTTIIGDQRSVNGVVWYRSTLTTTAMLYLSRSGVPSLGYKTFEVTTAAGKPVTTLRPASGIQSAKTQVFGVRPSGRNDRKHPRHRGRIARSSITTAQLPFNDLLRVEGSDASNVLYPVAPKSHVRKGNVDDRNS